MELKPGMRVRITKCCAEICLDKLEGKEGFLMRIENKGSIPYEVKIDDLGTSHFAAVEPIEPDNELVEQRAKISIVAELTARVDRIYEALNSYLTNWAEENSYMAQVALKLLNTDKTPCKKCGQDLPTHSSK